MRGYSKDLIKYLQKLWPNKKKEIIQKLWPNKKGNYPEND